MMRRLYHFRSKRRTAKALDKAEKLNAASNYLQPSAAVGDAGTISKDSQSSRPTANDNAVNPARTSDNDPIRDETSGDDSDASKTSPPLVTAIPARDLHDVFVTRHADEDLLFRTEFERIPAIVESRAAKCDYAKRAENKDKNRYKNVITCDESRVKLTTRDGDPPGSDYINASYIDGYHRKRKFIAAQGPKANTVDDFWRMVWEQRCRVVVMITQLNEMGRKKCEQYWPEAVGDACAYGDVTVRYQQSVDYGSFVKRVLRVSRADHSPTADHDEAAEEREVNQFQFHAWPDHGVPKCTSEIFRFRDRTLESQPADDHSPIVVHCSAGVGRTGTYIAFDLLFNQLDQTGQIDVFNLVVDFRTKRTEMVQSLDQYVLLHKLLMEVNLLGCTESSPEDFIERYNTLASEDGFESEFDKLSKSSPLSTRFGSGVYDHNKEKNLDDKIIPYEHSQVFVRMWPTEQVPIYYNASPLQGYSDKVRLIAAQGPLRNTAQDFWRVVMDNDVGVIVMLSHLDKAQQNDAEVHRYWPTSSDDPMRCGDVIISKRQQGGAGGDDIERDDASHVIISKLSVTSERRRELAHDVTHLRLVGWEDENRLEDFDSVFELRSVVIELLSRFTADSPPRCLVHCRDGCGRTGVFCSLINSLAYLDNERRVDVCRSVKDLRDCRPSMVHTVDQYKLCYDLVREYLTSRRAERANPSPPSPPSQAQHLQVVAQVHQATGIPPPPPDSDCSSGDCVLLCGKKEINPELIDGDVNDQRPPSD